VTIDPPDLNTILIGDAEESVEQALRRVEKEKEKRRFLREVRLMRHKLLVVYNEELGKALTRVGIRTALDIDTDNPLAARNGVLDQALKELVDDGLFFYEENGKHPRYVLVSVDGTAHDEEGDDDD
jgi:hypothetical protein